MARRINGAVRGVLAVVVLGTGVGVAATQGTAVQGDRDQAIASSPLYNVPGFGRTTDDAEAYDRILLHESFRRALEIKKCMAASGHEYEITDRFPANALAQIALDLGVAPASTAKPIISPQNLPQPERDNYYLAYLGITDAELHSEHGQGPPEELLAKGCYFQSERVPSARDIRTKYFDEFLEVGRSAERASNPMFSSCSAEAGSPVKVTSPGEMERAVADASSRAQRDTLIKILTECAKARASSYTSAYDEAATSFYRKHKSDFDAHSEKYRNYEKVIAADEEFLSWLATELRRLLDKYPEALGTTRLTASLPIDVVGETAAAVRTAFWAVGGGTAASSSGRPFPQSQMVCRDGFDWIQRRSGFWSLVARTVRDVDVTLSGCSLPIV